MKIIYDNIIFSLQKTGGISTYWSSLIERLLKTQETISFYGSDNNNLLAKKLSISQNKESFLSKSFLRYVPFMKRLLPGSIFHSSYYRVSLQKDIYNIVTVHDFTYERYGSGLSKWIHKLQKNFALKNADGIICVSENTKADLLLFCPWINKAPVRVIYNGVSKLFFPLLDPKSSLDEDFNVLNGKKYILFVGSRISYKNFRTAVNVVSSLSGYSLVIVGGGLLSVNEKIFLNEKLNGKFLYFSDLLPESLNILYNNAFCLIYPSFYEGFGIPIIEAMRSGCPVVATNTSSIPEVAGDSALLINDATDVFEYVEKVKLLENSLFRNKILESGFLQAEKFSWDRCFLETYQFYKEVLNLK